MRRCDLKQLTFRPFSSDDVVFVVAMDGVPVRVALGGAGLLGPSPVLTFYLPTDRGWRIGEDLSVNLLPAARWPWPRDNQPPEGNAELSLEQGESIRASRIPEARLAFECRIVATSPLAGLHGQSNVVVAEVIAAYQRWPRGCAIT
jgi:hypothetical protein